MSTWGAILYDKDYTFEIVADSPRGQWIKYGLETKG